MGLESPRPRVLHLFSEWKWTGPAEPIVNLCRQFRRQGYEVDLACARAPGNHPYSLEHRAHQRNVEPVLDFRLEKKFNLCANFKDVQALIEYMGREEVQIVHVHSSHDHFLGSRAARRVRNQPYVVRTNHHGMPLEPTFLARQLIRGNTHGWVTLSQSCCDADVRNFGLHPGHAIVVEGTIDLDRFNAAREYADVRPELGVAPDDILVGIVARVQKRRRFEVFLSALAEAMKKEPKLRAIIIGRGTNFDTLVGEPVKQLGLEDRVILPGYRADDYAAYLAAFDFKVFLVPGSDGSCRAVREAMALGKPVIVTRRGILPELVEDDKCGLVIDDSVENLTRAILKLARHPELRNRLGEAAAKKAQRCFGVELQAQAIGELYLKLAEGL